MAPTWRRITLPFLYGSPAEAIGRSHPSTRQKTARRVLSGRHRGHQFGEPDKIEHPAEIVGQGGQTELSPNLLQATHQKRALVHPLLDRAKRMLDRFATAIENLGVLG